MKKRLVVSLVVVMLFATMLPMMSASALIGPQYVSTSNGYGVHLRTAPSKDAEVLITIPYAAMVDSFEYYNDTWGYISYNGYYGYAMRRYFSSTKPSAKPTPSPSSTPVESNLFKNFVATNYYVTVRPSTPSGFVNLRWAPSKKEPILSNYHAGYTLHVIAQNATWAQVYDEATGVCGFMMRNFLSETGDGVVVGDSES